MKIKTADLIGRPLDYAVAQCRGLAPYFDGESLCLYRSQGNDPPCPEFSTEGDFAFDIMEREKIAAIPLGENSWSTEHANNFEGDWGTNTYEGPTLRIAVCRCFVASELGDEVEVPDELVEE